jgi:hypothetical protein
VGHVAVGDVVVKLAALIAEERQEPLDVLSRCRGCPLGENPADVLLQFGVAPLTPAEADDDKLLGQETLAHEIEERRDHLARHQVAGRAEDHQDGG